MIQRIQSLFLFAAALLMSAALFLPIWKFTSPEQPKEVGKPAIEITSTITMDAFNAVYVSPEGSNEISVAYIAVAIIASVLLSFFTLMKFKNRLLQMRLCLLNSFLSSAVIGVIFLGVSQTKTLMKEPADDWWQIAFFFPVVTVLFQLLAMRFIKRDEELVRSADRIR